MANENVFFVIKMPKTGNISNQFSSLMKEAYQSLKRRKLSPSWIDESKVFLEAFNTNDLFVIESFNGDAYMHLKKHNHRIISPFVIMYCDSESTRNPFSQIPKRNFPIFSQCMRGISVTSSNFSTEKKKLIEDKVFQMGGSYDSHLHRDINFVVSDSVVTTKYKACIKLSIKVMKIDWVFACWDRFQYEFERANASHIVSQYQLPIFHGLTITISQLDSEERNKVKVLVNENGGTYSPSLRFNVPNTYLLLREKSGDKYKYARLKNIPCIRLEWLYDSLEAKYALPEDDYLIDNDESVEKIFSNDNESTSTSVFETHAVDIGKDTACKAVVNKSSQNLTKKYDEKTLADLLDSLAAGVTDKNFLDNCVLHAVGFEQGLLESIRNTSRRCGAFYLTQLRPMVTHVIVGSAVTEEELKRLDSMEKLVTIDWLIDSIKKYDCCNHVRYRYDREAEPNTENVTKKIKTSIPSTSKFDVFSTTPEEISKRIDFKKFEMSNFKIHPSQNFKSLADDVEDMPISVSLKAPMNIGEPSSFSKSNGVVDFDKNEKSTENEEEIDEMETTEYSAPSTEHDSTTENSSKVLQNSHNKSQCVTQEMKLFMFSGFTLDTREDITNMAANKLMLKVSNDPSITEDVTHLILNEPYASEKTLSAIAAGIWILKPNYIQDSMKAGRLLSEVDYQWGFEFEWLSSSKHVRHRLMASSIKWRTHITKTKMKAFHDWSVLILNTSQMIQSCVKILKSGDAKIYLIDDYANRKSELQSLINTVRFAIIDIKFQTKPIFPKQAYLDYISTLCKDKKIIQYESITRWIIDGPGSFVDEKFFLTEQNIRDALAKIC